MRNITLLSGMLLLLNVVICEVRAADTFFDLGSPTVTSSTASFDVSLTFSGAPSDTLETLQLSVFGSDPSLTANDTDFSRFSFLQNTSVAPLMSWAASGTLGVSGLELLFPFDPFSGPFITPSDTTISLGTLAVDLTAIPPQTSLFVTLAGGPPGLDTDAGGTLGGIPVFSMAADPSHSVSFGDPNGVVFETPPGDSGSVPEPSTIALISLGFLLLCTRRFRQRR